MIGAKVDSRATITEVQFWMLGVYGAIEHRMRLFHVKD